VRVALALALGVALGVSGARFLADNDDDGPWVRGEGVLAELPEGPVAVRAETVVLPAGFRSQHVHGGPTFNSIESGEVEIADERGTSVYGPGEFFFEPGGRPHEIRVVADARLDVVRLLPPGARATTELP
jgi:hypothetical protein